MRQKQKFQRETNCASKRRQGAYDSVTKGKRQQRSPREEPFDIHNNFSLQSCVNSATDYFHYSRGNVASSEMT